MMQMMQMQGWMQMQQMAQQMQGPTATTQPAVQAPAPPAPPATFMSTSLVLVKPASKDGDLVRAEGQRTSVPIKVNLDSAQEPTGSYATANSLREKAGLSFPLDGSGWSWKLWVGQLVDNQPSDVAIIAGGTDAVSDGCWRELFSCKVIDGLKPVVFVQPCLAGHEGRDVDRKRSASLAVQCDAGTAQMAATLLSNARPTKVGKQVGKAVVQLDTDGRLDRLRTKVRELVEKSNTEPYVDPSLCKSIFILTDGIWNPPKFGVSDGVRVLKERGYFREISVESIDSSFLNEDGTLVRTLNKEKEMRGKLYFACICPPCICKANGKPWPHYEVSMESMSTGSSKGHHSSKTRDGGLVLRTFPAMVRKHMVQAHDGGFSDAKLSTATFLIGSALLQQPSAQKALQDFASAQAQSVEQPVAALTPADPPEPPPIVLRYPFDAPIDAKEREVAQLRMVDITRVKLAAGSMVSEQVFDLLRRYELQCAIKSGLAPEAVLVMPPYDFWLIDRRMQQCQKANSLVIDLSKPECSTFPIFKHLNILQKKVGLSTSVRCCIIKPSSDGEQPTFAVRGLVDPFGGLQLVSIPVLSPNHNAEMVWLPKFDIAFSFDSYPGLLKSRISRLHSFLQHVACSTIELVAPVVPHQPKEGPNKNVCAFSATLFLQKALQLLKEHGSTPALVQALRELTVNECEYHTYRKHAAKDINSLCNDYGRVKQAARIKERQKAKAGEPGASNA
jgi:hypothetical protein